MPKVTVVIPTYNREKLIKRALQSVFDQTYRDLEIIVCDDGSTDSTVEVVKSMQADAALPLRLEVLPFNLGVSAARNKGIFSAEGELIAFLDSDDTWKPEKLAKQVAYLEADSSYIGVGCNVEFVGADGRSRGAYAYSRTIDKNEEFFQLFYQCYITTSCFLVKKEALIYAGLFDVRLKSSEDRDLWWRLPRIGRLGFINEPLINYMIHEQSLSKTLCKATGKTYIPAIMRTVWYWRDKLSAEQIRQVLAKAHLLVAYDAADAGNKLSCIRHALTTVYYRHHSGEAGKLILSTLYRMILRK